MINFIALGQSQKEKVFMGYAQLSKKTTKKYQTLSNIRCNICVCGYVHAHLT